MRSAPVARPGDRPQYSSPGTEGQGGLLAAAIFLLQLVLLTDLIFRAERRRPEQATAVSLLILLLHSLAFRA